MIICCLSIAVCKRRISVRHFVVTVYSYAVSCQFTQAVIRISPPLLIGRAPFKSVVDNTYAFTIHMEFLYCIYRMPDLFSLFISSYLHFMNPVILCGRWAHSLMRRHVLCDTFSLVSIVLKRRGY